MSNNTKVYQINVGYVYKFVFHSSIESINGKYKLLNIMVLEDLLKLGIDLFKDVLNPIGMTQEDFNNNVLPNLDNKIRIFKLKNVEDVTKTYYIPEFLIIQQPEFGVKPYLRLGLAVNLGVFNNINRIEWIKNEIEDILRGKLGVNKEAIIFATEEVWLTDNEYQEIENERQNNIDNTESIYVINQKLRNEITNLQSLINEYEQLIIRLNE